MQINTKITLVYCAMLACFLFLAAALTRLQIFQAEKYQELALHNRIRRVSITAPRGIIFDRHGKVLAGNRPSYDVELVLDEVTDLDLLAKDLAALLYLDAQEIVRRARSGRYVPYLPFIIARDVGIEKITRLLETRRDLSGINISVRAIRHYPNGSVAAHVLGTLGPISPGEYKRWKSLGSSPQDIVGKSGIESLFNVPLSGRPGGMQVQVDSKGNKDEVLGYKVPQKGTDISLTLDLDLQKAVEKELAGKRGAVVVLDVASGEILAMASAPTFDPAIFVESSKRSQRTSILVDSHRPLMNRAIAGLYPAGSVFKTMVGLAGLEAGSLRGSTRYYCPGEFKLGKKAFHCWRKHGHGTVDLQEALKYSCNVFFYHAGLDTGPLRIQAMARAFGMGEHTGFLLQGESAGLVPTQEWKKKLGLGSWTKGDTINLSIGQGYLLVTPLQMATAAEALASWGIWRSPLIVRAADPMDSSMVPFAREIAVGKENLKRIRDGMMHVVNDPDATGHAAHLEDIVAAGKTGTVQTISDRANKKDHAWFVGYAPHDNPRIALAVIVEGSGSGGLIAAPVAREIFKAYFHAGPAAQP